MGSKQAEICKEEISGRFFFLLFLVGWVLVFFLLFFLVGLLLFFPELKMVK